MPRLYELVQFRDLTVGEEYEMGGKSFRVVQILPGFCTDLRYESNGFAGMYKTVIVEFPNGVRGMLEDTGSYETRPFARVVGVY